MDISDVKPCRACGKDLSEVNRRPDAAYCSVACRRAWAKQKYETLNGQATGRATATTGAIAELLVSADLLAHGYEVFRALSPACSCDLAILQDGKLLRVEVRSAWVTASGKVRAIGHKGRADILAMVHHRKGLIIYEPTLEKRRSVQ